MANDNRSSILVISIDEDKSTIAYQRDSKILYSKVVANGARTFDNAVIEFLKSEFGLLIGERTAREIWIELFKAPSPEVQPMRIRGRNVKSKEIREIFVTSDQIKEATDSITKAIINETQAILKQEAIETEFEYKLLFGGKSGKVKGLAKTLFSALMFQ